MNIEQALEIAARNEYHGGISDAAYVLAAEVLALREWKAKVEGQQPIGYISNNYPKNDGTIYNIQKTSDEHWHIPVYSLPADQSARIAELSEQLAEANDKLEKMFASASNISESAVTLLMQRDELKIKADRYDYLRENCFDTEEKQDGDLLGYVALIFESDLLIPYDSESVDKAIDAAIDAARGGV